MAVNKRFDLEKDLHQSEYILSKITDDTYAQNLYAAFCNTSWQKIDFMEILENNINWEVSWRGAGRIVADLRGNGETYMDYYCSGIKDEEIPETVEYLTKKPFRFRVAESCITDEIREDLRSIGWKEAKTDQ